MLDVAGQHFAESLRADGRSCSRSGLDREGGSPYKMGEVIKIASGKYLYSCSSLNICYHAVL